MNKRSTKWHQQLVDDVLSDPETRSEYEAFKLQLDLAEQMKKKRLQAHLTQETVAAKMDTQKTVVARLEAAGGKGRHSPSLSTLAKYADAIGYTLRIRLVPKSKEKYL